MAETDTTALPRPVPRRKWRRRLLRGVITVAGIVVTLLALAPALLFNPRAERRIARLAGRFLGRPMVIENLDFGWFTPLHIGRIALPAVEGEGEYPLFEAIRGVSSPLTLARLAKLPPYSVDIKIAKIEVNVVKLGKDRMNLTPILAKSAPDNAKKKPPAKPQKRGARPPSCPLKDLKIRLDRIDLRYVDMTTNTVAGVPDTMGVFFGQCALDAAIRISPPGAVTYKIERAEVGELGFASKAVELSIPPIKFSGQLAVRLPESTVEGKDLHLTVGDIADVTVQPFFNWTNGEWRAKADLNMGSLSNVLTAVRLLDEAVAARVPKLAGAVRITADFAGRVPEPGFDLSNPPPIAGEASVRLSDATIDGGTLYNVGGVNAASRLTVEENGRALKATLDLAVDSIAASAPAWGPLKGLSLKSSAVLREFDSLSIQSDLSVKSLLTDGSVRLGVDGLRALMPATNAVAPSPAMLFRTLRVNAEAAFNQDLKGISGLVTNLTCDGQIGLNFAFQSDPRTRLAGTAGLKVQNVNINWANRVQLNGMTGTWLATKTLLPAGRGRRPVSPAPGQIRIDSMSFNSPKVAAAIRQVSLGFQGIEQGGEVSFAAADLIGGPAEASFSLSEHGGNPEINGKITVTGINGGALMPGAKFRNREEADINAIADLSLSLPADPRGTILDYLRLRLRTMRIGKSAFARLLQGLDSRQETPQFQNAIAALSLGTPTGCELTLDRALVTMSAELRLAGGVTAPLPILDSAPLADIMNVYGLDSDAKMLGRLRWGLLLLTTSDLDELEKRLGRLP